ncbi:MAG: hypothetical protein J6Y35_05525 [Bacteroidales bacterium]|nr:hypothetical protein [Bacteroidales bacterium]
MGGTSNKTIVSSRIFGNMVDYFLFSVKTKDTLFTLAERLSDHCNCRFSMMPPMRVAESEECPMRPEFQMLYAQYEATGLEDCFVMDPVDRLNIVLFQNRAISFDKSKSALAETDYNGVFPFIDEGCDCFAFSPQGVCIGKCTPADFADYYLMVFSKKNNDADLLASHLAKIPDYTITDCTPNLFKTSSATKIFSAFFRSVFANAENQIRRIMRNNEKCFIGKIPESMLPPIPFIGLMNSFPISRNEISINNL